MQSKKMSMFETVVNTGAGFMVSVVLLNMVLPMYGFDVGPGQSVEIVCIFTIASILRGYLVRRLFNRVNKDR